MARMQARFFVFARVAKPTEQPAHSVIREMAVKITFPLFDATAARDRIMLRGRADRRDTPQPRLEVLAHKHSPSFDDDAGGEHVLLLSLLKTSLRKPPNREVRQDI